MATDDDDAATLRERVRDLEATVAQQQDTIEQLMPSRRAILAGGAGLVGGAALTGQASAQSAAGQVGTSSEPVDVEAASVTADSVNTEKAAVGGQDPINYFPPKRTGRNTEIDTSSPATSYTDLTLSSLPSDASIAIIGVLVAGDGTEDGRTSIELRENDVSRDEDLKFSGSAENGQWAIWDVGGWCPVDGSNVIEYASRNATRVIIRVHGYI